MTNGPTRAVTPPTIPSASLKQDGTIFEFLLPYPIHLVDQGDWPALQCKWDNEVATVYKPTMAIDSFSPQGRLGNESPDSYCSMIRVGVPSTGHGIASVWPLVEQVLSWIRVKARHYWLLHGSAGYGAIYRGSLFAREQLDVTQKNFARYGQTMVVRPLSADIWKSIETDINISKEPPVSESIFCDALLSLVAGDDAKAVLEMGVAAEVEVTNMLDQLASSAPQTAAKKSYVDDEGDWDRFAKKFLQWTPKLGLLDPRNFSPNGLPKDWVDSVLKLYKMRGSVAHSGKVKTASTDEVAGFAFATNALFAYCRNQRESIKLDTYAVTAGAEPSKQLVAFVTAGFVYEAETKGKLATG